MQAPSLDRRTYSFLPCCPAGKLASLAEAASQRADGYRNLAVPLLRGEWDGVGEGGVSTGPGLAAPPEQRVKSCVEVLLGAVPLWFKVGGCRSQVQHH